MNLTEREEHAMTGRRQGYGLSRCDLASGPFSPHPAGYVWATRFHPVIAPSLVRVSRYAFYPCDLVQR